MSELAERDMRQRGILDPERLNSMDVAVIGVGAIGRQAALQLAAIGVNNLELYDFDHVEVVNLAAQGFFEKDLGEPKVTAVANACREINSEINVAAFNTRYTKFTKLPPVVFCCVDSIEVRKLIWEHAGQDADCFIDARMSAETMRVFTATVAGGREHYPTTLFAAEDAFVGTCTAKTTIYCANIAAGIMVSQLSKWLRGMPAEAEVGFNLLANELNVVDMVRG